MSARDAQVVDDPSIDGSGEIQVSENPSAKGSMYDFRCANRSAGLSAPLWPHIILLESAVHTESQHPPDSPPPPTLKQNRRLDLDQGLSHLETRAVIK